VRRLAAAFSRTKAELAFRTPRRFALRARGRKDALERVRASAAFPLGPRPFALCGRAGNLRHGLVNPNHFSQDCFIPCHIRLLKIAFFNLN
jgi:hypothetical protein